MNNWIKNFSGPLIITLKKAVYLFDIPLFFFNFFLSKRFLIRKTNIKLVNSLSLGEKNQNTKFNY